MNEIIKDIINKGVWEQWKDEYSQLAGSQSPITEIFHKIIYNCLLNN